MTVAAALSLPAGRVSETTSLALDVDVQVTLGADAAR
jgi:hypothetical protein